MAKSNAGNRKPKAHTDICPRGEAIVYRFYWVALGWGSELQLLLMADKSENLGEGYLYCCFLFWKCKIWSCLFFLIILLRGALFLIWLHELEHQS
jgi:hypothetical protein